MRVNLTARYSMMIGGIIIAVAGTLSLLFLVTFQSSSIELREQSAAALQQNLTSQIQQRGATVASVLAERMVNPLYSLDMLAMLELLSETNALADVQYAYVVDANDRVVHDGTREVISFGARWRGNPIQINEPMPLSRTLPEPGETQQINAPVALGGELLGTIYIGMSLAPAIEQASAIDSELDLLMGDRMRSITGNLAFYSALLLIGGLLVAMITARSFARPIRRLAQYAREIGRGNNEAIEPIARSDELGILANSLTEMSHDLRLSAGEAEYLAYHDSLTRLPNRAHLKRTLRDAINYAEQRSEQLAVLFIDLDDFKKVNDTLGHEAGDEFLRVFAKRLGDELRTWNENNPSKVTLARLGGDEFTIVQQHIHDDGSAVKLAEMVLRILREPASIQGQSFVVGASIGITLSPRDTADMNVLLRNADKAMYRAKELGRNGFCLYDKSMDATATRRFSLEADLRNALNNNALSLHYQPIVESQSGEVVAVEALCRWQHPVLGYVQPSRFVQLADEIGESEHLDQYVVGQITHDMARIRDSGFASLQAAVNLSTLHHNKPAVIEHIFERLQHHGLEGNKLRVEVTEKTIMRNLGRSARSTSRLRDAGIGVWIDDFGTRISTLKHIDVLAISGIKIHNEFVDGISSGDNQRIVAQAITSMCHNLNLPVIAEGVEHQKQLEYLQEIRCDFSQGYLFARPMQLDDLLSYLHRQQKRGDGRLIIMRDHSA